jgi:hypothetical protein
MKNVIVSLRVYRGKLNYDANGNVTSENQIVKLKHDTQEYYNFLKNLRINGYHKVEVKKAVKMATYNTDEKDEDVTNLTQYASEVKAAFEPTSDRPKTAQELEIEKQGREIAELKALIKGGKAPVTKPEPEPKLKDDELEAARDKYMDVFGKKPNHLMKVASILGKIEEKESK